MSQKKDPISALFDRFPSPNADALIDPVFWILAIGTVLGGMAYVVIAFMAGAVAGLISLVVVPIMAFLWLAMLRIGLETAAAMFSIRGSFDRLERERHDASESSRDSASAAAGVASDAVSRRAAARQRAASAGLDATQLAVVDAIARHRGAEKAVLEQELDAAPVVLDAALATLISRKLIWQKADGTYRLYT